MRTFLGNVGAPEGRVCLEGLCELVHESHKLGALVFFLCVEAQVVSHFRHKHRSVILLSLDRRLLIAFLITRLLFFLDLLLFLDKVLPNLKIIN